MAQYAVPILDDTSRVPMNKLRTADLQELARNAVAAALTTTGPITVTANDVLNTINLAVSATANSTDAQLRDRSTHTGTQLSTTVSDFVEAVQDVVGAMLVGAGGATVTYNDTAGTATITAGSGGAGGTTDVEVVRDTVAAALRGTNGISINTVAGDDAADTITVSFNKVTAGLDQVNNTSDANKPLSAAAIAANAGLQENIDNKSELTHTHTASSITGALGLANMWVGGIVVIKWSGTAWSYNGVTITSRPTSNTSVTMMALGGATAPSFAQAGDVWLKDLAA